MHEFKLKSQQTPYLQAFLLELKILSKIRSWREKIIVSTGARIFERYALTMAKKLVHYYLTILNFRHTMVQDPGLSTNKPLEKVNKLTFRFTKNVKDMNC